VTLMKTGDATCSFCGKDYPGASSKGRVVMGARVFICRDCVDICVDVFAGYDTTWAEDKIRQLTEKLRNRISN
jgi:hypothetical protein